MSTITLTIPGEFADKLRRLDEARTAGASADVLRMYAEIGPSAIGLLQAGLTIEREREEIMREVAK